MALVVEILQLNEIKISQKILLLPDEPLQTARTEINETAGKTGGRAIQILYPGYVYFQILSHAGKTSKLNIEMKIEQGYEITKQKKPTIKLIHEGTEEVKEITTEGEWETISFTFSTTKDSLNDLYIYNYSQRNSDKITVSKIEITEI